MIYQRAFRVTSLFTNAMHTQVSMGCDKDKCRVISNGIDYDRLSGIPLKEPDGWIDIGAVVRLAPIKDIKTMIYAFFELSARVQNVRLHIMGGVDDEEYAEECYALVDQLKIKNIIFTGQCRYCQIYGKAGFYDTYKHFRRTATIGSGIFCRKTSVCDNGCRMLQRTS